MAAINITDLNNAKLDVDHIALLATTLAPTAIDRFGVVKPTVQGAIDTLKAYNSRGAWAALTAYAVKDLVSNSGTWYVCVQAHTSSAAFATDVSSKWRVHQGATASDVALVSAGAVYVEAYRLGATDSEAIQAALDYVGAAMDGMMASIVFEAGREYVYNATGNLKYINNLTIDLNGATLKRAAASTTVTTLSADIGTGQTTIYLTSIPSNWKVGDFLTAFSGPADSQTSRDPVRITAINQGLLTVTLFTGFDVFGAYTTIIPAGCSVGKSFSAFAGRPSSETGGVELEPGVNANVHIKNGIIDGNGAAQVNHSWRYCQEIFLQSSNGSVQNITFHDTTAECIVGHGLRVANNRFLDLAGSCFHTSVHDETLEINSASWFVNNFVDGANIATQTVVGHAEGAITFSWGAGNLIIADNDMRNGAEGVIGSFGPSTGEMADKWLIFSGNICNTFSKFFYNIDLPVEGVIVHDNILVNITAISEQTGKLLTSGSSSVGGNIVIGGESPISGAYRASNAIFGPLGAGTISQVKMMARGGAVAGFDYSRLSANPAAIEGSSALLGMVTSDAGIAGVAWFSPSGTSAGSFYQLWTPSTKRLKFLQNETGAALEFATPVYISSISTYADNAAALAGGLTAGRTYKTATGVLMIVY